ncbi:unnamed protein product [Leptosia nina]|uniref:Uncharacterized protein n=1 Tax=Leptosia nina TaxID=320188 RepID=A0AAV1JWG1_9NEOP
MLFTTIAPRGRNAVARVRGCRGTITRCLPLACVIAPLPLYSLGPTAFHSVLVCYTHTGARLECGDAWYARSYDFCTCVRVPFASLPELPFTFQSYSLLDPRVVLCKVIRWKLDDI